VLPHREHFTGLPGASRLSGTSYSAPQDGQTILMRS
jgi:hypothetical protein